MNTSPPDRGRSRAELDWLNRLFDLPTSEREAHLADLTLRDTGMADVVRRLLSSADALEADEVASPGWASEQDRIVAGTVIGGRFRVLHPLGAGGMGEVFLAQRTDEVEQLVAIKILHDGGRAASRARARREQQILAKLAHPNIAGLIDGGVAENGRPWFAMDYVDGERLLAWCDHRRSSIAERVRLFVSICRAVQFTHRNLVLHRDLKPSNILVDNEGVPKLLDFGIAKIMDANQTDETRTIAMTPAYAAPEQLRGDRATTASDLYQLGGVLYELVSGVSMAEARNRSTRDATVTAELPRPYQVLAARNDAKADTAEVARVRNESPERFVRLLKGDLGRIIAKATAARAAERYDTVQAFADDLECWLGGLPVRAHRPSLGYSLGKLLRRHTWAAAAIAMLSVGLVAVTVFAIGKADSERHQREQAETQRREAEQQRDLARSQRERSEAMLDFLRSVFRQADPDVSGGGDLKVTELLARAQAALDQRKDVDDVTHAVLLSELGSAFSNLGQPQAALAPAERAVALLEPQREQHATEYLDSLKTLLVAENFLARYTDEIDRVDKALPFAKSLSTDRKTAAYAALLSARSTALNLLGRPAEAEVDAREALRHLDSIGAGDSDGAVDVLIALAVNLTLQAKLPEAQTALRRILTLEARDPPIKKSDLHTAKMILANVLYDSGRARDGVELMGSVPAEIEHMFGSSYYTTIASKMLLLQGHLAMGDPQRARALYEQLKPAFSASGAQFARAQGYAASGMLRYELAVGRFREAAQHARRYLGTQPEGAPADLRRVHEVRRLYGEAQLHLGQSEPALRTFEAVLGELAPGEAARRAEIEDGIGRAQLARGDSAAAIESLHRAAEHFSHLQGADAPAVLRSEIHQLFARALAGGGAQALDRLRGKRTALVAALGSEDTLQVWQFDVLLDAVCRQLGRPGIDAARRARADAGLRGIAGTSAPPAYVGLSSF